MIRRILPKSWLVMKAVQAADTVLLTVPNQLGVDFNLKMLEAIVKEVKPALTTK